MMEVTQAVPPAVDFKDKIKTNGVLSPTKLTEKKSGEMDKLLEKSEVLVKVAKGKDVSTSVTLNGSVDLEDIFADNIDDPDLLNTEVINGEVGHDDMDILEDEFLYDIEELKSNHKVVDEIILEEDKSKDVLKKTEHADFKEEKSKNVVSNNEKDNDKLSEENLDKKAVNNEAEAQVETKTDGEKETADLGAEIGDLNEGKAEEKMSEKFENIKNAANKLSTEIIDENESLPETTISNSVVESRTDKRLCSIESNTEKVATNNKDPKYGDSEKVVEEEPLSAPKSGETSNIKEVKIKAENSKDEQPNKALKPSDCDIINLDSPMAVEDKEEKVEKKVEKEKTNLSKPSQGESTESSELVEDNLVPNKRRRESRTSREWRTSRKSRASRESLENLEGKGKTKQETQGNESPNSKRRKSCLKDNFNEDDILFLDEKLEIEEEKETIPIKETESKDMDNDKTAEEPKSKEQNEDIMLVDYKSDIEEEGIELILTKEKESTEGPKNKIAPQTEKLKESEVDDDDDDVVFLEEENIETEGDSKKTILENVNKDDKKVNLKKSEDKIKEGKKVEKVKVERSSQSKVTQDKVGNDSDDDVVLLDDDLQENEAEKEKSKGDAASSKADSLTSKADSIKRQDSLDGKSEDKKDKPVAANSTKVNSMDDDDDVVLLEVDDQRTTKKDDLTKIEEAIDRASNEETKEKTTKKGDLEISLDTSKYEKVDKVKAKQDEDDDEVVFMEEVRNTEKDQSKEQKNKPTSAPFTRSSSRKSSKDADETDQSKSNAIPADNSDNAQDKFPDKSEEDTANLDGDNNLLEEGKPPEICSNDEVSDPENSNEPLPKQIKVGDDEISQSSLTLETEGVKEEGLDRKSLKRSISGDSLLQESKKLKAASETVVEKKERYDLLVPRPPSKKPVELNLDFIKRFKKSISKMSKADLEELVLQKIVEAIVQKSEFSEMRDLIEKQEKVIAMHRTKMADITKQFRDLEMVHNRVVKDIETRNQQFIMPVKITRAVGLQVLIPKRIEQNGGLKTSTSSERVAAPSSSPSPAAGTTTEMTKRKCAQKITPLRPDTALSPMNRSFPPSIAQNVSNNSPATSSPQLSGAISTPHSKPFQKILPRAAPTPPTPQQNATQSAPAQYIIQQPSFNPAPNQVVQAVRKSTNSLRSAAQPTVQRPALTAQSPPDRPRVPPMILKKSGTNGQVLTVASPANIAVVATPPTAAPPNKSFIDLTDEDDARPQPQTNVLPALVAIPSQAPRVSYVVNKTSSAPQRVTVTQNSTNMTRIPAVRTRAPYAIAPKPAQPTQQSPVTPVQSGPRMPAATAIRRSHPAPLPKSPPALSNPAWKAPPPRPAIRINNIDSGIVISWTMDEMNDQNAEVTSYQIYAYQETSAPPQVEAWRHVGDVKAMLLPMAVTLTQFQEGQRYYFAVRAVDMHSRCGPFSIPKTWA